MSSSSVKQFKVVLVGDGGVGKSTYLKRLLTGEFEKKYIATLGVEVHPLHFRTNYGDIVFNVWDTAGQEKYRGLKEGYYIMADACIAMFDCTNRLSEKNVERWITDVKRVVPNSPLVVCGNKADIAPKPHSEISKVATAFFTSAKTCQNLDRPFLELARTLTRHDDLQFLEQEAMVPPTVSIRKEDIAAIHRQLEEPTPRVRDFEDLRELNAFRAVGKIW